MTTNEVRWKLHSYYADKERIENLKNDLKEYRLMDGVGAQIITDMPTSHSNSSVVERMGERIEYIREMENELDRLMRIKRSIDQIYMYLKEPARTIVEMRYFLLHNPNDVRQRKYNWIEIAAEVNYSEAYCKEIDCKVILQIQNKLYELSYVLPTLQTTVL
jgi:hypothetical protein